MTRLSACLNPTGVWRQMATIHFHQSCNFFLMFIFKAFSTPDLIGVFLKNLHEKIIFEMLIGHEHFHTECEYHAAKKHPFVLDRGLLRCKRTHHPIMMVMQNRRTRLPWQRQQLTSWLTSSLLVSLGAKRCLTDEIRKKKKKLLNVWCVRRFIFVKRELYTNLKSRTGLVRFWLQCKSRDGWVCCLSNTST